MRLGKRLGIIVLSILLAFPTLFGCSKRKGIIHLDDEKCYDNRFLCLEEDLLNRISTVQMSSVRGELNPIWIKDDAKFVFADDKEASSAFVFEITSGKADYKCSFELEEGDHLIGIHKWNDAYYCSIERGTGKDRECVIAEYDSQFALMRRSKVSGSGDELVASQMDRSGMIYLAYRDRITVLDKDLNERNSWTPDNVWINSCFLSGEGIIYLSLIDDKGWAIYSLDSENLSKKANYLIEKIRLEDEIVVLGELGDHSLLIEVNNMWYRYFAAKSVMTKQISLYNNGVYVPCDSVSVDGEVVSCVGLNEAGKWNLYQIIISETEIEITTITIVVDEELPWADWIDYLQFKWNSKTLPYKINVQKVNMEQQMDKIIADIQTGEAADLFYIDEATTTRFISADVCQDMLPLLSNDSGFKESDFFEGPWESGKNQKGELLFISPFFEIDALWHSQDDPIDRHLTWDDLKQMLNSSAYKHLFQDNGDFYLSGVFWDSFLSQDIDTQKVKEYLDFCTVCDTGDSPSNISIAEQLKTREIAFLTNSVGQFGYYLALTEYFGQDPIACYYPGYAHLRAFSNGSFVVSVNSKEKEAAGEFLRYALSEEALLGQSRDKKYAQIRMSCVEKEAETCIAEYVKGTPLRDIGVNFALFTKAESEEMLNITDRDRLSAFTPSGLRRNTDPERSFDVYEKLLSEARFVFDDSYVRSIFIEESLAYFQGDRDIDTTASVISSRIRAYLGERK